MKYYAVGVGNQIGIYNSWDVCKKQVHGVPNATYKSFSSLQEAQQYMKQYSDDNNVLRVHVDASQKMMDSFLKPATPNPQKALPVEKKVCTIPQEVANTKSLVYIYTDGACVDNGNVCAKAGIGVYYGEDDPRNVSQMFDGKQTNNVAEVKAVLSAYRQIVSEHDDTKKYIICTDSQYALRYATSTGRRHAKEHWKDDIPNRELVKELYESISSHPNISMKHVKAHTTNTDEHSEGNRQADRLANAAIGHKHCPYDEKHRVYLNVPFAEKETAKQLGCKWNPRNKKWWIQEDHSNIAKIVNAYCRES